MEVHLAIPNFGPGSTPHSLIEIARQAEELGFDGIATSDHILVPRGNPQRYERVFDALVVLGNLAAVTSSVKLITSVVVPLMRNPFVIAKQAATIDQFSGGRLILGLGAGWNEKEFASVHAEFGNRGRRLDEVLRLFRHLWSGSSEPFEGEFFAYEDGVFDPLPVQKEGLPIWLGGNSDPAIKRAARVGDGWESTTLDVEAWRPRAEQIRSEAGGRRLNVGARAKLRGSPDEMLAGARRWREVGADHLMVDLGITDGFLERMRVVSQEVLPGLAP